MKKNRIVLLIVFISISLLGIILLQGYWIKNAIDTYEKQFSQNTNNALVTVANAISDREMRDYLSVYQKLKDSIGEPVESQLIDVFQYVDKNRDDENIYLYYSAILEEDYKINSNLFDSRISDSISIKDYTSLKSTIIFDDAFEKEMNNMSSMEKLQMMEEISLIDDNFFRSSEISEFLPKYSFSKSLNSSIEVTCSTLNKKDANIFSVLTSGIYIFFG